MTTRARTRTCILMATIALAMASASAQTDAQKAFATVKSLPGTWEGKGHDGNTFQVIFKVTGGGSAVESEILVPQEDMISMFHMDGPNRLLMTPEPGVRPHAEDGADADRR
jgi:hypothetical protein